MDAPSSATIPTPTDAGDRLVASTAHAVREALPGATIGFGRAADLVLDPANPNLHRLAGRFAHGAGGWTLENRCRATTMVLTDDDSGSYARLVPGRAIPLPFPGSSLTLEVGGRTYRVHVRCTVHGAAPEVGRGGAAAAEPTLPHSACPPLNPEQAALLRLLVAPRLFGPITAAELLPNVDLAERLGWTLPKLNRKLDHLCAKFARAGVAGLLPDGTARGACERRLRLVDAIVENAWVDALVGPGARR